jgi:hypothetical protein
MNCFLSKSMLAEIKAITCLSLPIVAFNLIALYSNIKLPYVNIDFVIVGFALVFRNATIKALCIVFLLSVTVISQSSEIAGALYYFDIYQSLRFLSYANNWPLNSLILPGLCVIASVIALTTILLKVSQAVNRIILIPGLFVVLLFSDVFGGTNAIKVGDTRSHINFITSPTFAVFQAVRDLIMAEPDPPVQWVVKPASHELLKEALMNANGNSFVLSIGFESLGLPLASEERNLLVGIFTQAFVKHKLVVFQTEKFKGGTLNGELRGLCGLKINPMTLVLTEENISDCIPQIASKASWETYAVHGNTGGFYDRSNVYERVGFKHRFFYRELKGNGASVCDDAFSGICDGSAIATAIASMSPSSSKQFMHFMSLETHFPLPHNTDDLDIECRKMGSSYYIKVCDSVRAIVNGIYSSAIVPDHIVIFGDHPPPFISGRNRESFSKNEVPVLHFIKI